MTEAMPFLQKYDITFLRPPTIPAGVRFHTYSGEGSRTAFYIWQDPAMQKLHGCGHEYVDAGADGKV